MIDSTSTIPSPPASIPDDLADTLRHQDAATLEALAGYAQALADSQRDANSLAEHEQPIEDLDDDQPDGDSETRPEEVPRKASIVTKPINGYEYYYWQWRDGDNIKSKYKAPVNPKQ